MDQDEQSAGSDIPSSAQEDKPTEEELQILRVYPGLSLEELRHMMNHLGF